MYHITSFQHPPQGLREWSADQNLAQIVSASARISLNRLELNVDVAFFKTVKKKLVKYLGLSIAGFFSPSLRWEKPFICSKTESK